MNILEGLKRIYIVISLVPILVCAVGGWEAWGKRPYPFTYSDALAEGYTSAQVAEHLAFLHGQDMINLRDKGVSDDQLIGSLLQQRFTPHGQSYPRTGEGWLRELPERWTRQTKRVAFGVLGAICATAVMILIWFVFRWVIVGFFPSQRMMQPAARTDRFRD